MKKLFVLGIFICILFTSIGYSALNTELSISGNALVDVSGDIRITNVYTKSATNGGYTEYNPTFTNQTTNTNVVLPNSNSTITLIVEVTNTSDDYYHLDSIEQALNTNPSIKYDIKDRDILYFPGNSVREIEITFSYNFMGTVNNTSVNLDYNFEIVPYEKLEYVRFSGTQYIDTGLMNTGDYIFETEFMQTAYTTGDGGWIFSGRTTSSYTLGVFIGINGVYNGYGGVTSPQYPKLYMNAWYDLYFSRSKFTLGTTTYRVNGGTIVPDAYSRTILFGGATTGWNGGYDARNFTGNIKCFKITNAVNNAVLKYYVPAKLFATGEVGYWDLVEDKFYGNDGTGLFLEP